LVASSSGRRYRCFEQQLSWQVIYKARWLLVLAVHEDTATSQIQLKLP